MSGNPQLDRLQSMASDKGETWDLSPKDQEAIWWILTDYHRLKAELANARKDTARLDYYTRLASDASDASLRKYISLCQTAEDTGWRDAIDVTAGEEATWLT